MYGKKLTGTIVLVSLRVIKWRGRASCACTLIQMMHTDTDKCGTNNGRQSLIVEDLIILCGNPLISSGCVGT